MPGRAVPGRVVPGLQPPGVPFPNLRIRAQMGQRRITMRSDANGIDVEVVESKEGREVTEKFRVKDAAELKQRHPEAHRLLEKFQAEQGVNQRAALEARAAQEAQAIDELRKRLGNENEMGKRRMLQQAIQLHERRLEALQQALPPMR